MRSRSMNKLNLLGMVLLASVPAVAQAQTHAKDTTMNRTVVVEQQYNPNIMDAQKVNVLPEVRELTTTPDEVEYDRNMAPAAVLPGTAMAAYAGEEKQDPAKQGYIRAGYGNVGNVELEGNYLFDLTAGDKLNLSLGMQGWNGKVYYPSASEKWDSRFYRTKAAMDYVHRFNALDFNIAGNFGVSNFNFMPGALMDHQRFTSGDVHAGLTSTDPSLPLRFNAGTGLYLFQRGHNVYAPGREDTFNETMVRTKGDFAGDVASDQQVGVAFEMNNLFYHNDAFDNYATLLLKPYYALTDEEAWKLHLGVNVDLAFGYGKKLRVSPDVRMTYTFSDSYVLYANATGGRILNDYRRLEQFNPYGELVRQHESSYEQLNASLGFNLSPAEGFWLNISGGYQMVKDDLYDDIAYVERHDSQWFISFAQTGTRNLNAALQAGYSYKDVLGIMAKGQYYNWKADNEAALRFKPEARFDFQANLRPVRALNLNLAYEWVKRSEIKPYTVRLREKNLSNLSLGATWELFDNISIYARASNLLGRKEAYYICSPVPGPGYLGGMAFRF